MNQRYMMDTNTVSYILKGRSLAARVKLAGLASHEVACISTITEGELRFGLAKSRNAVALRSLLEAFFTKIEILDWGREEAEIYGDLRARQEAVGKTLGSLDMLIASHAIATGAILVTNDKAFGHVPELSTTVNWASDVN